MKKVLHIITRFIHGGADDNVLKTVTGLPKEEYEVHLGFGKHSAKIMRDQAIACNVVLKRFSLLRHLNYLMPFSVIQMYKYMKKHRFDIVHTHSTEAGIIGRIAAKAAGIPVIVHTVEGIPFSSTRPWIINKLAHMGEKITAVFSDKIITLSDSISRDYLSRGIGKRHQYTTIHAGIDLDMIAASTIEKLENKSSFNVIMVARLTEGKGYNVYFDAIRKINDPKLHFFSLGSGDLEKQYRKHTMDISDHLTLLGSVDTADKVYATMKACDILVLPSYREGTPKVIFEAMALGKPVIATNIAGIPEQVIHNKTGYLINPGDSLALASQISRLKNNPDLRKKMSESALKESLRFSMEKMVNKTIKLYDELSRGKL